MDTTRVEIIGKHLDKIVHSLTKDTQGLSSAEVALIAAVIGALAAILPQLFIFLLTRCKEKRNLKNDLIADERRIAFLLTEYYKELVMHKIHKQYWFKTSELPANSKEEAKEWYNRHFLSIQKSFETLTKIRITTSDYIKTVTYYTNLCGQNEIIKQELNNLKSFKPRKASTFVEVKTYNQLLLAHDIEERELNDVYIFYSNCFDKINGQMIIKK